MKRRSFLQCSGAALAAAPLMGTLRSARAEAPAAAPQRRVLPINRGWRYSPQPVAGFEARDFDDRAFERVVVPHSNKLLPWHGFDEHESQFVSSYRRRFKLPAGARGQRVFVDFEGVMTAATVWINGRKLGEYRGGYTPFSFELTADVDWTGPNVLAVSVDSTERADIPPFGDIVDYLTFGGIYREVALRIVPASGFIADFAAAPREVMSDRPGLDVHCEIDGAAEGASVEATLLDGERAIATARGPVSGGAAALALEQLAGIKRWGLDVPKLYRLQLRLWQGGRVVDQEERRIGFREARFTPDGFMLNGEVVKLRGLNRHQTYPFMGAAVAARGQRQDAITLKRQLKINIVRTSHYPQSRHFLDACDELGLLVLEEIPGWQHVGDVAWQALAIDNVERMVRRDRHHASIILWGVRINESRDFHDFYTRTNALARRLDPTRPTCGIRYFQESEFLEDVFTMNDFEFPLKAPNHSAYLNTEFVGHTFPTKSTDNAARLTEHMLRHARIHDQLASDPRYAGGLGWCAFDYNTHGNFGAGDHICYHGVSDIFREMKPAAGFYRSQCEPSDEVVLEPAFHWCTADDYQWLKQVMFCSNCEALRVYVGNQLIQEIAPDRAQFPHLRHPPFTIDLYKAANDTDRDLRVEGLMAGRVVIERRWSGKSVDRGFELRADTSELIADGADLTRVVFRVTDEFGELKPYATGAIELKLEGPATLIGDAPFALVGGLGAVWVRAGEQPGRVTLTARHPTLGKRSVVLALKPAVAELA
ncbi:MAG: beta galactosidase jelly roll domain-containing protein [Paucibacter sp.]|nr:beta galactosidase jelly roll domain-containing protein [Roseateles sp.]